MLKTDVVKFFGNEHRAAKALDVSRQYVNRWGEIIPEVQALKLQLITKGGLTYDPELYGDKA